MIYKLQKGKIVTKAISLAEKLGIPKAMRSNSKALEDPYYWGYQQWNSRYNAAIKSGNLKEAQRLRALHFITKAPNTKIIEATGMPKEVYHGGQQKFTVFDSSKTRPDYDYGTSTNMFSDNKNVALGYANNDPDKLHSVYLNLQNILEKDFKGNPWNGSVNNSGKFQIVPEYGTTYSNEQEAEAALQKILDQRYPNDPVKQAEQRHYMYVFELMDPPHPERSTNAFSDEIANTPTLDGGIVRNVKDYYDLPKFDENPELYKEITSPHIDYFVKDPRNIKSSAAITYDDSGRIVPIVKRDNFHNPDVRHEQGGIIKAQGGLGKAIRKMPNLLLEEIGAGRKAASEFFEHPVVKQSYEHNKDIAKRLGITLQDRPENIAEIVNRPIGVGYEAYKNNGELGAIHHSGIDDPNDRFSISWIPMTELDAKRIGFHESLHRGFYSAPIKYVNTDFDYYKNIYQPTYKYWHWKTSKLLKPGAMDSYLGDVHSGEAGTNLAEVGKIAGVKMGEKWPGDEKFWETLDKWPKDKKFMLKYLNTDTKAGRRHIWDAMAAKYFTVGTATAFSNWLNNSKDEETKKPAL